MLSLSDRPGFTCETCTFKVDQEGMVACPMCETTSPIPSYSVSVDEYNMLRLSQHLGYPLLTQGSQLENLDVLLVAQGKPRAEFCLGSTYDPRLVTKAIQCGVFPMSINYWEVDIPAWKLHRRRSVLRDIAQTFQQPKGVKKRSRKFVLTMNTAWDQAIRLIREKHDRCWLCPGLERALLYINEHGRESGVRIHCFEVWTKNDRRLAAVEIGFSCGSCYTSATGAYVVSGAGAVQLACTAALLERWNMECWDFGMHMDYKEEMGASTIPRKEWQRLILELRSQKRDFPLENGFCSCSEVLRPPD